MKSDHVRSNRESSMPDRSSTRSSVEAIADNEWANEWSLIDPAQVQGEVRAEAMTQLQQTLGNQRAQRVAKAAPDRATPVQRQEEDSWLDYLSTDNLSMPDLGGMGQAWDTISGGLGGASESWLGGVRGAASNVLGGAQGWGESLWGGASGAGSSAWSGIEGAGSALAGGFEQATNGDILGGITSGLSGVGSSLWGGASGAYGAMRGGARNAAQSWLGGLAAGGENLLTGASGAAGAIGGAASGLWEQATGSPVPSFNWEDLIM
ncbi:hypothetical protein GPROT1_01543 [Gammaproteobacteria bacterium]|nr:hypothetical protein GPROT1_01543 [Gammaproteobacteria bacterium]